MQRDVVFKHVSQLPMSFVNYATNDSGSSKCKNASDVRKSDAWNWNITKNKRQNENTSCWIIIELEEKKVKLNWSFVAVNRILFNFDYAQINDRYFFLFQFFGSMSLNECN